MKKCPPYFKQPVGLDFEPLPSDIRRFLEKVLVSELTGCWEWTAAMDGKGYGCFRFNRSKVWAHRFSYAVFRRPLLPTLTVEHKCRNPSCVNPWHLELLTNSENAANGNRCRGRKTATATVDSEVPF